jgi:hypothetical protein
MMLHHTWIRCTRCQGRVLLHSAPTDWWTQGSRLPVPRATLRALIQRHRCPPHTDQAPYRHEQERWVLGYRDTEPMPFERMHNASEDASPLGYAEPFPWDGDGAP